MLYFQIRKKIGSVVRRIDFFVSAIKKNNFLLFSIIFLGFFVRYYGIYWDSGFHLHPDERMLIMVAERIRFFTNLNPDFFNYGSLPLYILKGISQIIDIVLKINTANYQGMLFTGRLLSIFFDIFSIVFVYKIAFILFHNKKIALISSFFYSIAFFPVQNTHFFISDVFLTLWLTILLYRIILFIKCYSMKNLFLMALFFSLSIATKLTAIIFFPFIIAFITYSTFIQKKKSVFQNRNRLLLYVYYPFLFTVFTLIFFFCFMPFAFLSWTRFITDIVAQIQMNSDPYIFPYTLQYVDTSVYLYYVKNIFLWGLGPPISLLCIVGLLFFFFSRQQYKKQKNMMFLFLIFYIFYFLLIGRSAVKFMRYMLPLYPFFAVLAGYGFSKIFFSRLMKAIIMGIVILWSLIFINIYSYPHTRITASNWILKNIPFGKTLAIEHWDDRLPLFDNQNYQIIELPLYDQPDDSQKWNLISEKLEQSDYIVIASNRLYTPLQKLADCKKFSICYPLTAMYYDELFHGRLPFTKVAEFSAYPNLTFGSICLQINDQTADESFTVYDHPKIMIFKKIF